MEYPEDTPLGVRIVDIRAEKGGQLYALETKLGDSRYHADQAIKDQFLYDHRGYDGVYVVRQTKDGEINVISPKGV